MSLLAVLDETPLIVVAAAAAPVGRWKPWTTAWKASKWPYEIACPAAQPSMLMSPRGASFDRDRTLLLSRDNLLLLKKASMDSRSSGTS